MRENDVQRAAVRTWFSEREAGKRRERISLKYCTVCRHSRFPEGRMNQRQNIQ